MIFDTTKCTLGEGPLWHPQRHSLFWFDILSKRLFERDMKMENAQTHQFDEHVSAAGWIDKDRLLIASETALFEYDLNAGSRKNLVALEVENKITRSNDGRADPWGGFWIGTMGKLAEPNAGAIYRFIDGTLTKLFDKITISNSICFAPNKSCAYFTDTPTQKIMKIALDDAGWPVGEPVLFADVAPYNPDGSVVDINGNLWNAQWGASRVACYDANGDFQKEQVFGATQISCPAFGGDDLGTLFATSAAIGLKKKDHETAGSTWGHAISAQGQEEHQVKLG